MEKKVKIVILGAIKNDCGELLISQRNDPKVPEAHLKWDLIGGANEFGEDPQETIHREALEETGFAVKVEGLLPEVVSHVWHHDDYLLQVVVFCYRCRAIQKETNPHDVKIENLKWVSLKDLSDYDFLPTVQPFLKLLKAS